VGRRSFIVVPITLKNILLPTMREYSYSLMARKIVGRKWFEKCRKRFI
jgi:hypothetical protein